jgi:hypothetical protein
MSWIEAQSTFAIGGFVFGFCYLLAGVIFCLTLMLSRRAVAQSLKEIAPTTLTPLGVILGLLIGFLAARVWANLDRANQYVGQEAGALRETILLTDALPVPSDEPTSDTLEKFSNRVVVSLQTLSKACSQSQKIVRNREM